jgi:acetyl/propionyl-CoA carboxylase alpha subunit
VGVGVLEFLVDGSRAFLIDGLARLNTGFHVWDQVAQTQAVSWQLRTQGICCGIPQMAPESEWKSGLSVRFYAEDPLLNLPCPGKIEELDYTETNHLKEEEVELNLSYQVGEDVSFRDSGLLGLLTIVSSSSKKAMNLAKNAIQNLWIAGSIQTNQRFLLELLNHPWVREEIFHAGFIDEEFLPPICPSLSLMQNAVSLCIGYLRHSRDTQCPSFRWYVGDRWVKEFSFSEPEKVRTYVTPLVSAQSDLECRWMVRIGTWCLMVRRVDIHKWKERKKSLTLNALVSGQIQSILYRPEIEIPIRQPIVIIYSLGIFVPHFLPANVCILDWKVKSEDYVFMGQELADFRILREKDDSG